MRRHRSVASIMMAALSFTPVYSLPAMASDPATVNPGYWNLIYGPDGTYCYFYPNSGNSTYLPDTNTGEWYNFRAAPNDTAIWFCGAPPPPCCSGGGGGGGGGGGDGGGGGCFVKGAVVTMADGTQKPIEEVACGDMVRGRYGEANVVLALSRPKLNGRPLYLINGIHYTTHDHPHWTVRGPVALSPESLKNTCGVDHPVILADGSVVERKHVGLTHEVTKLHKQDLLIGFDQVSAVNSVETIYADPSVQLYDLVLGGSHTFFVDGYLVTGWAREDDFNYTVWQPRLVLDDVNLPFRAVA